MMKKFWQGRPSPASCCHQPGDEERFVVERRGAAHYYNPLPPIFPTSIPPFLPLAFVLLQRFLPISNTHTLTHHHLQQMVISCTKITDVCLHSYRRQKYGLHIHNSLAYRDTVRSTDTSYSSLAFWLLHLPHQTHARLLLSTQALPRHSLLSQCRTGFTCKRTRSSHFDQQEKYDPCCTQRAKTNTQQRYLQISHTEFHPSQKINAGRTHTNLFTPSSKVQSVMCPISGNA